MSYLFGVSKNLRILLANAGARAAKRESRVVARGRSSSHATIRSTLIAAAIATCCKWVFATSPYRARRSPKARTPYGGVNSALVGWRLAQRAQTNFAKVFLTNLGS